MKYHQKLVESTEIIVNSFYPAFHLLRKLMEELIKQEMLSLGRSLLIQPFCLIVLHYAIASSSCSSAPICYK